MNYLVALCVSFIYVFLKAFQQKNVVFDNYALIAPTSMFMAFCEATIIILYVKNTFWIFIPIGIGASLGSMLAMYVYNRWVRKK